MAQAVLGFNEQLERIGEVVVVVIARRAAVGLYRGRRQRWWFVPLLLLVIRPLSVVAGAGGRADVSAPQRRLIGWFGIRGIGSLYYLMLRDQPRPARRRLADRSSRSTVTVVVSSIVVHGISVTPLMARYRRRRGGNGPSDKR